jgi:hypothetical protein
MRLRLSILLIGLFTLAGCSRREVAPQPLSQEQRSAVENDVHKFMVQVAHDITTGGPTAWQKEFADDPAFFMAVNGAMVFPNRQVATQVIQNLPSMIKQIELRWGDDLRVDPLTQDLAVVGTSYTEIQTDPQGHQKTDSGFFTAVAELRNGRWQFRDAHWSDPLAKTPDTAAQ